MRKYFLVAISMLVIIGLVGGFALAKSYKSSKSAWLGIYSQTVDKELAESFDLSVDHGVVVNEVIEGSPAEDAGLEEDDIIIAVNGTKVTDNEELVEMIGDSHPGDKVTLTVMRDEEELEIPVILKERPSEKSLWGTAKPKSKNFSYSFNFDGKRSYIGVNLTDLTDQLGGYFGVERGKGALISEVEKDSPAAKAGLQAGDVIVAIDDEKVVEADDVSELVEDHKPGDTVNVTVIRDKKTKNIAVEVGESENNSLGYFYGQPYAPDISVSVPKIRKLIQKRLPTVDAELEINDFQEALRAYKKEMGEFKKEMESLKKEMSELRQQLKQ
jgi:C-terminal processing protease CtpA/Prc